MEKQLKCRLLLSLKEMTLRKVAVRLWSDPDILTSKSLFGSYGYHHTEIRNDWIVNIEGKIKDKILEFGLPATLTKQMMDIVRPIGLQIKRRMEFQIDEDLVSDNSEKNLPISAKLFWTVSGAIDYRKMAEELVCCVELPVIQRYQIACAYCLEKHIPFLWEELPATTKDYLYRHKLGNCSYSLETCMFACWPHIFKGHLSELNYLWRRHRNLTSFYQWAFEFSAEKRCKAATEYFFQKLTLEEREASLKRTVKALVRDRTRPESTFLSHFRDEILCFLLSVMTPEQQVETIKAHPIPILLCFLEWPLQDLFLENASLIWTFLPPSDYGELLWMMADRFKRADHYFPKLFEDFFIQSPQDLKTGFMYKNHYFYSSSAGRFLSIFLEFGDSDSIKVIFRNVDAADRVKLVFDDYVNVLFHEFIVTERGPLVALCLREAGLSKEERERLIESLRGLHEFDRKKVELTKPKFKTRRVP